MSFQLITPVILLIFNRPEKTERVFASIRAAKPSQLLIVADGPRETHPEDTQKCAATRAIVEQVDWECRVERNYSEINLGCKFRVSSGLDWVFSKVETAIILEDDCLPHPTFFRFCETLLEYYQRDERVMVISGNNFISNHQRSKSSYYFSRYINFWGWATWRRAWCHYDVEMCNWPSIREQNWLKDLLQDKRAVSYWSKIFDLTYQELIDTWDYQWVFTCWCQSGLSIVPNVNLVSNIGFGQESTHTSIDSKNASAIPASEMIFPLNHPTFFIADTRADRLLHQRYLTINLFERIQLFIVRHLNPKNF